MSKNRLDYITSFSRRLLRLSRRLTSDDWAELTKYLDEIAKEAEQLVEEYYEKPKR